MLTSLQALKQDGWIDSRWGEATRTGSADSELLSAAQVPAEHASPTC